MELSPKEYCIFIASHMKHNARLQYLLECLKSLISQTVQIPIYLSISFDSNDVQSYCMDRLINEHDISNCGFLNICERGQPTSQMQHFNLLSKEYGELHKWIMFCDDDDTYQPNRTLHIATIITNTQKQINENNVGLSLAGLYESSSNKDHRQHRHEYWCYCVNIVLIKQFMEIVEKHPIILNDKCCDVLFGEYLRRKNNNWIFMKLPVHYYNYRVDDNSGSITGFIKSKQSLYTNITTPPQMDSNNWQEYVFNWNEHLHDNIDIYLHDTYLRSLVGCNFEEILKSEFLANYPLLSYVDKDHVIKINEKHILVKAICDQLYDIKL